MERLWAPWRMEYILENNKDSGCIFCQKSQEDNDRKNYIIVRKKTVFSLLNIYPYNNGHLMVAPYTHKAHLEELSSSELEELMLLTREMVVLLKRTMNPQGFNVGLNLGEIAGAGIKDHMHIHIVPRWAGDTNFMPAISDTKVIPQALNKTYAALLEKIA